MVVIFQPLIFKDENVSFKEGVLTFAEAKLLDKFLWDWIKLPPTKIDSL